MSSPPLAYLRTNPLTGKVAINMHKECLEFETHGIV